jgi:hypothetical protein
MKRNPSLFIMLGRAKVHKERSALQKLLLSLMMMMRVFHILLFGMFQWVHIERDTQRIPKVFLMMMMKKTILLFAIMMEKMTLLFQFKEGCAEEKTLENQEKFQK